jgi:hypothetical protein
VVRSISEVRVPDVVKTGMQPKLLWISRAW